MSWFTSLALSYCLGVLYALFYLFDPVQGDEEEPVEGIADGQDAQADPVVAQQKSHQKAFLSESTNQP